MRKKVKDHTAVPEQCAAHLQLLSRHASQLTDLSLGLTSLAPSEAEPFFALHFPRLRTLSLGGLYAPLLRRHAAQLTALHLRFLEPEDFAVIVDSDETHLLAKLASVDSVRARTFTHRSNPTQVPPGGVARGVSAQPPERAGVREGRYHK